MEIVKKNVIQKENNLQIKNRNDEYFIQHPSRMIFFKLSMQCIHKPVQKIYIRFVVV